VLHQLSHSRIYDAALFINASTNLSKAGGVVNGFFEKNEKTIMSLLASC
jgi:hypothetical protein